MFGLVVTRFIFLQNLDVSKNEIPREDIVPYHPFYDELYRGKQADDINFFPENKTNLDDGALFQFKNVICNDGDDQQFGGNNFCVRWCEEIQDLKAETYWNKRLLPVIKRLLPLKKFKNLPQ